MCECLKSLIKIFIVPGPPENLEMASTKACRERFEGADRVIRGSPIIEGHRVGRSPGSAVPPGFVSVLCVAYVFYTLDYKRS